MILLLVLFSACRQGGAGTAATAANPPAEQPATPAAPGPYVVTAEALDRYIRYQDKALDVQAEVLRALSRLEKKDAGAGPEAVEQVQRQAESLTKLRREAALTDRDVRELERIVGDVISRRALASTSEEAASLAELENLAARLSEADRAKLEKSLSAARDQQRAAEALTEERRLYGDGNVDAVLSRERELTRLWQRTIATFAGTP